MSEEKHEQTELASVTSEGSLPPPDPAVEPPSPVSTPAAETGASVALTDAEVERQMRRLSRRGFLWSGAAVASGLAAFHWIDTRREDEGVPWPFRRVLEINEQIARDTLPPTHLAPTFSPQRVGDRVNGDLGLSDDFDPETWELTITGLATPPKNTDEDEPALVLTLRDIKALPRREMVTELKCIEGWSEVVSWAGARLADLMARHPPATRSGDPPDVSKRPEDLFGYVALATPDSGYYVGLEIESALHPQTLLCYEMNGKPLTAEHGAPLRLVIPVKYGIKNIKRIGTLRYTDTRPADYWAERGYDWYAGL
jgi:DMSO/TMAO reductase YedYZ molybdopterin-dependent catalytic subunit